MPFACGMHTPPALVGDRGLMYITCNCGGQAAGPPRASQDRPSERWSLSMMAATSPAGSPGGALSGARLPVGLVLTAARAELRAGTRNASDSRLICAMTEGGPAKTAGPVDGMAAAPFLRRWPRPGAE